MGKCGSHGKVMLQALFLCLPVQPILMWSLSHSVLQSVFTLLSASPSVTPHLCLPCRHFLSLVVPASPCRLSSPCPGFDFASLPLSPSLCAFLNLHWASRVRQLGSPFSGLASCPASLSALPLLGPVLNPTLRPWEAAAARPPSLPPPQAPPLWTCSSSMWKS